MTSRCVSYVLIFFSPSRGKKYSEGPGKRIEGLPFWHKGTPNKVGDEDKNHIGGGRLHFCAGVRVERV